MPADKEQHQQNEPLAKKARTDSAGSSELEPPTTAPFPVMADEVTTVTYPQPEDNEEEDEGDDDESDCDDDGPLTQEQIEEAVDIMFNQALEHSPAVSETVGALSAEQQRYFADRLSQTKTEISSFVFDFVSKNPGATVEDVMSEVGSVMSPGQSPER